MRGGIKLAAVFEALWSGKDFVDYDSDEFQRRMRANDLLIGLSY